MRRTDKPQKHRFINRAQSGLPPLALTLPQTRSKREKLHRQGRLENQKENPMPPKKATAAAESANDTDEVKGPVIIQPRKPTDWGALLVKVASNHWRTLRLEIQIRDRLLAGKPAKLDAAKAMIKARGFEDVLEARQAVVTDPTEREAAAEEVKDEGLCEFHRRDGKAGIWFPTNNFKAGLKENWSVLTLRQKNRGSRGAMAEGVFVFSEPDPALTEAGKPQENAERDYVYLGIEPAGVHTAVSHTTGPSGPVSSIKRHEYLVRPRLVFHIAIADAIRDKLPDEDFARTVYHFGEHGLGACRSQGFGRFDVVSLTEL